MAQFIVLLQMAMSLLFLVGTAESSAAQACGTSFSKVGCFVDQRRPFPLLLLNGRENIQWKQWNEFLEKFVCHCADKAVAAGFSYFGIQFWGECWAGENPDVTYDADGQSDNCIGRDFLPCDLLGSTNCAGVEGVNYVYKINLQESPIVCEDVDGKCQEYSQYCEEYLHMAENCPKTCNLC